MEELIRKIILPMVNKPDALMITVMPQIEGEPLEIVVTADKDDVSRLIGKNGVVAEAIREVCSIKARLNDLRVRIKFESYEEN